MFEELISQVEQDLFLFLINKELGSFRRNAPIRVDIGREVVSNKSSEEKHQKINYPKCLRVSYKCFENLLIFLSSQPSQ